MLVDGEKPLDKIQYLFMRSLSIIRNRNFFNMINNIYKNPTGNIILNGEI
jgi:hypothetical protein